MMDREHRRFRILIPLLLGLLTMAFTAAQSGMVTGSGRLRGGTSASDYDISIAGPIQISFPRNGGEATGSFSADTSTGREGTDLGHIIYLTFEGDFGGFPGGEIGGTISGEYTDTYLAEAQYELLRLLCDGFGGAAYGDCSSTSPDYDFHTRDVSGSWQGRLTEGGTGNGTFEFSTPQYSDPENIFNPKRISGTWEISRFSAGQAAPLAMPSLPDFSFLTGPPLLNAPSLSPGNIPAIAGLGIAGAAAGLLLSQALAAVAASRAAATLPGGIVAGTRIGPGVELDWGAGTRTPSPALPPGRARSPVDGRIVSAGQARHEQAQLEAGYTYDPERDAFVYVPERVEQFIAGPSYATLQAQRERAARNVVRTQERQARAQRFREEQIREEMAWQEQDYQRHMADIRRAERAITVLKTVEFVADVGVSTVAHFVPVAGPMIDKAYSWIKIGAAGASSAYHEGGEAAVTEIAKRTVSKVVSDRFKPTGTPTFKPDQLVTRMGGEILKEHVVETTQDLLVSQGVDLVHEKGRQLITGAP